MKALRLLFLVLLPCEIYAQSTYQLDLPAPCSSCFVVADTLTVSACKSYLSPSGQKIWTQSGLYRDTLQHARLCDTMVTIDLTVTTIDTIISRNGDSLIAHATDAAYQWFNCQTGQLYSGDTNSFFVPMQSGNYAVIISKGGCSDTSSCVSFITGLESSFNHKIDVYPNPSNGLVNVNIGIPIPQIVVVVFNPQGQEINRFTYNHTSKFTLALPPVAGIYFLQLITSNGGDASFTIIRQE